MKGKGLRSFIEEVKQIPGVVDASSMRYDVKAPTGFGGLNWPSQKPGEEIQFGNLEVHYGLLELFQYKLKEGRTFSREFSSEDSKIIFNESAVAAMGLNDPIGKTISLYGKDCEIIGVAKDFHFESLHKKVKPCFFKLTSDTFPIAWNVVVKIKAGIINPLKSLRSE
ncbi:MAG: hypothetical protein JNK79_06555 [Chitinophagaceae bacterium]|nr:hypothetical protein [Chitinophagaceae bacterium]